MEALEWVLGRQFGWVGYILNWLSQTVAHPDLLQQNTKL